MMTIEQLRQTIDAFERDLKINKSGQFIFYSETGPVDLPLIRALFEVIERQQQEIDTLKAQ